MKIFRDKNLRVAAAVFAVVIGMVGMSFAAVPLYKLFCRVTGYDGTTQVAEAAPGIVLDRQVRVEFNTDISPDLPWEFRSEIRRTDLRLGQDLLVNFIARNEASTPLTGTAIYNVTPLKAGKYFNKIECFCFGLQTLNPGQEVNMPVLFYIDPAMDTDPDMADVKVITLSYTFYKSDSQVLENALEAFYNRPVADGTPSPGPAKGVN